MLYHDESIKMMTWNIYIGASLAPLIDTTKEQVPAAVTEIIDQVMQTDFYARAQAIAKIIKLETPEFIGLQEVAEWTVSSACSYEQMNFLTILLRELCALGLDYGIVAINRNYSWTLPDSRGQSVSLVDRDVILYRSDLPIQITHIEEKNYKENLVVQIGGQPYTFVRGYATADIRLCHKKLKLVNTRLEASEDADAIRRKQSRQLKEAIDCTALPVFLLGSFSIVEGEPIYNRYITEGFQDAWAIAGYGPGYTAFQASNLLNPVSSLSQRFEYIFFKSDSFIEGIETVGDQQRDRTINGLWPSDHAGIVGRFTLPLWL